MNKVGPVDIAAARLCREVAHALVGVGLLPPPLLVGLALEADGSRRLLRVQMRPAKTAPGTPAGVSRETEVVSVTGCFRGVAELPSTSEHFEQFREWSCTHPRHPLAVKYQALAAWLAASRVDQRFFALARRFVDDECRRQQRELIDAVQRLRERSRHPPVWSSLSDDHERASSTTQILIE